MLKATMLKIIGNSSSQLINRVLGTSSIIPPVIFGECNYDIEIRCKHCAHKTLCCGICQWLYENKSKELIKTEDDHQYSQKPYCYILNCILYHPIF